MKENKNIFKRYADYLKNNPENKWFKRKLYGWGWVPVKWQGWVVVLIFIAFIVWNGLDLSLASMDGNVTDSVAIWFLIKIVICIAVLLFICYKKGEKPRWQWGVPKE